MPATCCWQASRTEAINCFPVFSGVSDKEEFSSGVRDHFFIRFHWVQFTKSSFLDSFD